MATTIGSFDLASLKNLRDDVTQYFWFESNSSSAWGSGAHVTLYPESQFTNPNHANYLKGQNIIMNTDGFSIRNGGLPMMVLNNDSLDFNLVDTIAGTYVKTATFSSTGAQIGQSDGAHSVIDADGMRVYGSSDGGTQLANIGYGLGASSISGETTNAPYYSLGVRGNENNDFIHDYVGTYSNTKTYNVGNLVLYNDSVYICSIKITTPEEWNQRHWSVPIGNYSNSEGMYTISAGYASHAEGGDGTTAFGLYSHAEGENTKALGDCSHAEGMDCIAEGESSHAEGRDTRAIGHQSHVEGMSCIAKGECSHAGNFETIASGFAQTVIGLYNIEDDTPITNPSNFYIDRQYAFIIGNGTSDNARSNALTVDWDGNVVCTSAKKNLVYTGEYVWLYANQTAAETAGQISLSQSYKNCLPSGKYGVEKSELADDLFSVSNGVVTFLKKGRYRVHGQVYFYNGFTANDIMVAGILVNNASSTARLTRMKTTVTNPYTTINCEFPISVGVVNSATVSLAALNETGARGKIGLSGYTRMMVECLAVYE